jgi:hypothetical protein
VLGGSEWVLRVVRGHRVLLIRWHPSTGVDVLC